LEEEPAVDDVASGDVVLVNKDSKIEKDGKTNCWLEVVHP